MGMIVRTVVTGLVASLVLGLAQGSAGANPTIVVDAASGKVLEEHDSTRPWYPASLSKLMTIYTVFKALQDKRVDGGMPIAISPRAARQAPSKMGYPVGTMITVDDALKMLIVHSANDIAVALAEGVSGSVDNFAAEMNANSKALGMTQSYWVNPNGLPDPRQVTSARDMALIADAIITKFPQYDQLFQIQTIRSGDRILRTHNALVYRYPGTDGMKTGFTCAAGFNVVATATREGRKLITVVMGAPTAKDRTNQAVALFESNYNNPGGGFFTTAPLASQLPPSTYAAPLDMHGIACNRKRGGDAAAESEDTAEVLPGSAQPASAASPLLTNWSIAAPIDVGPYLGPRRPLFKLPGTPILADLPAGTTTQEASAKGGTEAAGYAEMSSGMAVPSQLTDPKLNARHKSVKKLAKEKLADNPAAGKKAKPAKTGKSHKPVHKKKHHSDD